MEQGKAIRFVDSDNRDLFHIMDGASIKLIFPPEKGDNEKPVVRTYPCKYIDETHVQIGTDEWHIHNFAESMGEYGIRYEPDVQLHNVAIASLTEDEDKYIDLHSEEGKTRIGFLEGAFKNRDIYYLGFYDNESHAISNTTQFQAELHSMIYALRNDKGRQSNCLLKNHAWMLEYCRSHPEAQIRGGDPLQQNTTQYGFKVDTETRRYYIRCHVTKEEYSTRFMIYAYDKTALMLDHESPVNLNTLAQAAETERKRLFVDMDGTLAVFTPVDELEKLYEKGYFAGLKPHQNVVDSIRAIINNESNIEVFSLSAYLSDSTFALNEKNAWLNSILPELDAEHRIFVPCGESKADAIEDIKSTDYLLDDYTRNLNQWEQAGGRGIKLLNGINHTRGSWEHDCIDFNKGPMQLAHNLCNIILHGVKIQDAPARLTSRHGPER